MKRTIAVSLLALFLAAPAFAETVKLRSKVGEINTVTGFVRLFRLNEKTQDVEPIRVDVDERSAQFGGFDSLRELSVGDEVYAEINYNEFSHEYKALHIDLIVKRYPNLVSFSPRYQQPLVAGGNPLYQNAVEEEPLQRQPLQSGSQKVGENHPS